MWGSNHFHKSFLPLIVYRRVAQMARPAKNEATRPNTIVRISPVATNKTKISWLYSQMNWYWMREVKLRLAHYSELCVRVLELRKKYAAGQCWTVCLITRITGAFCIFAGSHAICLKAATLLGHHITLPKDPANCAMPYKQLAKSLKGAGKLCHRIMIHIEFWEPSRGRFVDTW